MSKSTEYRKAVQRGERPAETQYIAPEWIETLQELAEDVCKYLPEWYELSLVFEDGCASIQLWDMRRYAEIPSDRIVELPDSADKSLAEQLNDALLVANGVTYE